jgi:hypothetical protein
LEAGFSKINAHSEDVLEKYFFFQLMLFKFFELINKRGWKILILQLTVTQIEKVDTVFSAH